MGRKSKKNTARAAKSNRRSRRSRRRRRLSRGIHPLIWVGGALGIVAILVVLGLWKPRAFARSSTPSRGEDPTELLPLAEVKRPLRGEHDMALIPQQTPAPQQALANASRPQLDMPSVNHDFGSIPKRPDVAHIFAVQNTGDADLVIRNLVTSCGCTGRNCQAASFRLAIAPT